MYRNLTIRVVLLLYCSCVGVSNADAATLFAYCAGGAISGPKIQYRSPVFAYEDDLNKPRRQAEIEAAFSRYLEENYIGSQKQRFVDCDIRGSKADAEKSRADHQPLSGISGVNVPWSFNGR